jgi:hypothetical protein
MSAPRCAAVSMIARSSSFSVLGLGLLQESIDA